MMMGPLFFHATQFPRSMSRDCILDGSILVLCYLREFDKVVGGCWSFGAIYRSVPVLNSFPSLYPDFCFEMCLYLQQGYDVGTLFPGFSSLPIPFSTIQSLTHNLVL